MPFDFEMSPVEAARDLAHLEGLVFLDSAGNFPADTPELVSLVAALPHRTLRGNLDSAMDRSALRLALRAGRDAAFLHGGLCGWISYEGDFVFGDYREVMKYSHAEKRWLGGGHCADFLKAPALEQSVTQARITEFSPLTSVQEFLAAVSRAQEFITAGDIYQVNLSQIYEAQVKGGSLFSLYEMLRKVSPAPLAAYLALDGREVLSSSPEAFLKIRGRSVETRPIKGTRPRLPGAVADKRVREELKSSPKEIAELVMITDLLRNDLGSICELGSVQVTKMLQLESLAQVHHLVSTVTGELRGDIDAVDALAACFPGGSISGAPKKRAREIISLLENSPRGIYCGALGFLGYDGDATFNIAIRTVVREGGTLRYQVGAGIVADSVPQQEFQETLHKAAGIRLAISTWQENYPPLGQRHLRPL